MPDPPPDRLHPRARGPGWAAGRRPRPAWAAVWRVALIAAAACVSLAVNWQRWINPFVDSGREMNTPARLAAGEKLYRDVVFYYGPAGPWLQALVLRVGQIAGQPPLSNRAPRADQASLSNQTSAAGPESPPNAAAQHGPPTLPQGQAAPSPRPTLQPAQPPPPPSPPTAAPPPPLPPAAASPTHPARRSWLPLELACLALSAAILVLLYRLAASAGSPRSALAGTTLAAAFCLGAPHGGGFIFPYSASSLYALAGALLALDASLRPTSWRRRALVAAGIALALTARFEIGAAAGLILLVAALCSRAAGAGERADTATPESAAGGRGTTPAGSAPGQTAPQADDQGQCQSRTWPCFGLGQTAPRSDDRCAAAAGRRVFWTAAADLALGAAVAIAVYAAAFAGVPWRLLLGQGPLTHMLAMPPEWKGFYGSVSGLARLDRSLPELAWGVGLDLVALAVCALTLEPRSAMPTRRQISSPATPLVTRESGAAPRRGRPEKGSAGAALPRLLFCVAVAAGVAAFAHWGGPRRWPWGRFSDALPPLLLPLPLLAAAAAAAMLRRPLDGRGRARFLLFALAAALATRVLLGLEIGPEMAAYCALPLALLLAAAAVLAGDLLAPRLRDPGGFRFRLAALAAGLTALYLFRVGTLAFGPHIVRLETPGGALRLPWKEAYAIEGTLGYLAARARPGDALASFPEAGFFNFVLGLPNPMREEEIFPGVLGSGREAAAIARLLASRPRFVLLANRPTPEFGARAFGTDYAAGLWSAVEDHYTLAATFGNAPDWTPIGGRRFFVRVYELVPAPR
jgi:hypothetical protein